jgi:tetratricopeptide (TPR) repeat protein
VYPLLIAIGLASSIVLSLILIPENPFYCTAPFLGTVVFVPTLMLLWRRTSDKVHPYFEKAQRLAQAGNVDQAVAALEEARAWSGWQLFLGKQINNQVGLLYFAASQEKKAIDFLRDGYARSPEGHLILGAALYREKKTDEAVEALENGIRFNKKSPILYNFLAWILAKENKKPAAIAVLERCMKKLKTDPETADNLDRLRNDKKMVMRVFGQMWYMLKFETPPGMGGQATPIRKGFRQPPKAGKKKKGR